MITSQSVNILEVKARIKAIMRRAAARSQKKRKQKSYR